MNHPFEQTSEGANQSVRRGAFITLEGIEGAGKSTCLPVVCEILEQQSLSVVTTREPGGTPLAEMIRNLVLGVDVSDTKESPTENTETLLMFASRAQHLGQVIEPALARGEWVLCDRFTDSTLAYQGGGRELGLDRIMHLANWVHADRWPDLTLLFDVPVEIGEARISHRGKDRMEQERRSFFEKTRQSYLQLAQENPQRIKLIDAAQSPEQVAQQVRVTVGRFIEDFTRRLGAQDQLNRLGRQDQ